MTVAAVRRRLEEANAPTILQALFTETLGQTEVEAQDGCKAIVSVDILNGNRTASAEYTNAGTLCRFEVRQNSIVFSCFDLSDDCVLLSTTSLMIEDILTGSTEDVVSEFMERVQ